MSDVPLGVFLSGGLDSSLVAGIVSKHVKNLHSFSVGFKDSPDLKAARKVADHLKTIHHEVIFDFEEGLKMIPEVIKHIETFDVTSIRASTPMLILSREAKKYITVTLSGEGADEMFGGYVYFQDTDDKYELQSELVNKVKWLYTSDVNRCDKSTMGGGLEARVPFLDFELLDYVMNINPSEKLFKSGKKIEKYILRKAFENDNLIPDEILWRVKEQFSDGVGIIIH
jgi:asparagine synthase (glutamine-hydrolysing)